jgi:fermentation-respiration switch protein FrsA (DUF1100 family)
MVEFSRAGVRFSPNGIELDGYVYRPAGAGPHPCVVMSHGFGGLKEMSIDASAERFAAAGYACLLYDHRNFGPSGGEVRQEIDPWEQVKDMRGAITFAQTLDGIAPERVALWGTSYSGGEAIVVGAVDRRVKAVIAQVPFISGSRTVERMVPVPLFPAVLQHIYADKLARWRGAAPACQPISQEGTEGNEWAKRAGAGTLYRNEITVQTLDHTLYFEPIDFIQRVAPTPLLMLVATRDTRTPLDLQLEAFAKAREPKELVWLEGGHYDPYQVNHDKASDAVIDFLRRQL